MPWNPHSMMLKSRRKRAGTESSALFPATSRWRVAQAAKHLQQSNAKMRKHHIGLRENNTSTVNAILLGTMLRAYITATLKQAIAPWSAGYLCHLKIWHARSLACMVLPLRGDYSATTCRSETLPCGVVIVHKYRFLPSVPIRFWVWCCFLRSVLPLGISLTLHHIP